MSFRDSVAYQQAVVRAQRQRAAMNHTAQALRDTGKNALALRARVFANCEVQS